MMEWQSEEGVSDVQRILRSFRGEEDLKRLFWSVLGYDRINQPITCPTLASGREELIDDVRLFAQHDQLSVVLVRAASVTDRPFLMTLCHQLASRFALLVVLLRDDGGRRWQVVVPDDQTKHYLRCLAIPGYKSQTAETARALWAFSAFDDVSGTERSAFDIFLELDLWFPGPQLPERTDLPELDEYLSDIRNYPLLTRRQEQLPENVRRLIVHNLRLAIWVATKFRLHGMTLADQVQNANLGLIEAAKRFDRSRGTRFSTYAYHWLAQAVRRSRVNSLNLIRWPAYLAWDVYHKNRSARQRRRLKPGERLIDSLDEPTVQEMASELRCHDGAAERRIWVEEVGASCRAAVDSLPAMARQVIVLRYGLNGQHEHTLEEVGHKLRYTRERIRQVQIDAEGRLRLRLKTTAPEVFAHYDHNGPR
jgi:RNA polymerase primary sigma factor